jgi:hypothetical protein
METISHPSHSSKSQGAAAEGVNEAIRRRAEEIYVRNGRIPGRDVENWVQAEKEILRETAESSSRRKAVVINVNGIRYVGEYGLDSAEGYTPGEFAAGDSISVRFDGDKMFVKRRNGRELETTLVKPAGTKNVG